MHLQDLYVLLNGKLLHQALKPLDVQIIPQGCAVQPSRMLWSGLLQCC